MCRCIVFFGPICYYGGGFGNVNKNTFKKKKMIETIQSATRILNVLLVPNGKELSKRKDKGITCQATLDMFLSLAGFWPC